jgi:tetratricopeptide (TPR) repeat protein
MTAWFAVALLALASPEVVASPESGTVRFSNIRFDTGGNWVVAEQYPDMILRPANPAIADDASILIIAAAPHLGSATDARDQAWSESLAGNPTRGAVTITEERPVPANGAELGTYAATDPAGGLWVSVVQDGSYFTRLVMTANTDLAYTMGRQFLEPLLASIQIVPPETGTVSVIPGGPGGGSGPVDFDWDGPGRTDFGIYDHNCLHYEDELRSLVGAGTPFIGSVQPAAADWSSALARVRALLEDPEARRAYEAAGQFASPQSPDHYTAGAVASLLNGDPVAALAQLYAGVEKSPDNPDLLFNFAGTLAQAGFANESLAVIARLESGGAGLEMAAGANPDAAVSYLKGFNEMLLGRLDEAAAHFGNAKRLDPFINEAGQALALVQAHQGSGGQARITYRDSLWRFKPKMLVYCGASAQGEETEEARPPVDDMFDTSMGTPGELVRFQHPNSINDLERFHEEMTNRAKEHLQRQQPWNARVERLGPGLPPHDASPEAAHADKMSLLIGTLDEEEPYVVWLREQDWAAADAAGVASGNAKAGILRKANETVMAGRHITCGDWRSWVNTAIAETGPLAKQAELAQRRHARDWYRIATGLNAKIGHPEWHEWQGLQLRAELEGTNAQMLLYMSQLYGFFYVRDCQDPEDVTGEFGGPPVDAGSPCSQLFGDLSVSHSMEIPGGPKFGFDIGCDKIKVEVEGDLLKGGSHGFGTALGGFASLEVTRKGDYSIFAGARGEASGPGMGGGVKSGLYLEGGPEGVREMGGRVNMSAKAGFGQLAQSAGDDMKFNILPSTPKASRGPALKSFRAP